MNSKGIVCEYNSDGSYNKTLARWMIGSEPVWTEIEGGKRGVEVTRLYTP
jgi:hypothetical protein